MPADYRLLHASDLHISHLPFSLSPGLPNPQWSQQAMHEWLTGHDDAVLEAFARFVYQSGYYGTKRDPLANPPYTEPLFDQVLVTGDLASSGYPDDLERAYRTLGEHQPPPNRRDRARSEPERQARQPARRCAHRSAIVFRHPRQAATHRRAGHFAWRSGSDHTKSRPEISLAFVAGWFGQGRAYDAVVADLKATTDQIVQAFQGKAQADPLCADPVVLWAVHFDPTTTSRTLALLEHPKLIDAAKDRKIPFLLCGHTHFSTVMPLTSETTALIAGTATQANSSNRFDAAETANDIQLLNLHVPDHPGGPLELRVVWYRYKEPAGSNPSGRFVRIP